MLDVEDGEHLLLRGARDGVDRRQKAAVALNEEQVALGLGRAQLDGINILGAVLRRGGGRTMGGNSGEGRSFAGLKGLLGA